MAKSTKIHVIPRDDGWIVRKDGTFQPTSVHTTQKDAVAVGRKIAREKNTQLVIHGRNGRVRECINYSTVRIIPSLREVLLPFEPAGASRKAIKNAVLAAMRELQTKSKGSSRSSNHQ